MDMTGERLIPVPRDRVWAALNDPEALKACIPGCESLEAVSPTQMKAAASIKLGPIAAKFAGDVTLSDIDPPNGYTISGEGRGGVAGFAKGGAKVRLAEGEGGTLLSYTVEAQVGGKIAQLGARLIDSTAKSMAEQFFAKFVAQLEAAEAARGAAAADPAPAAGTAGRPEIDPGTAGAAQTGAPRRRAAFWAATAAVVIAAALVAWRFSAS